MDRGRVGVFIGYIEGTTKNFRIWAPNRKAIIIVYNLRCSEHKKGGDMDLSIPIFSTLNAAPVRRPLGRLLTRLP